MKCPHCYGYAPDNNYKCPSCGKVLKEGLTPDDFLQVPEKKPSLTPFHFFLIVVVVGVAILVYFMVQRGEKEPAQPSPGKTSMKQQTQISKPVISTPSDNKKIDLSESEEMFELEEPPPFTDEVERTEEKPEASSMDPRSARDRSATQIGSISRTPGEALDIENMVQTGNTTIFDFYSDYCKPCQRISPLLARLDAKRDDVVVVKIDINRPGLQGIDWYSPVARQFNIRSLPFFIVYDVFGNRSHEGDAARREVFSMIRREGIR